MTVNSLVHEQFLARVPDELPVRRIAIFLVITFSLNWLPAVYFLQEGIRFTDRNLPVFTYNVVLILVSFSPAVGHLLTRWLTNEGISREQLLLPLRLRTRWREYVAVAVVPLLLAIVGALIYFAVFPQYLIAQPLETFASSVEAVSGLGTVTALLVVLLTTLVSLTLGALMVFGEELGWRAYLLPKLVPLGPRTATLLTGVVWGVWHWPYIYIGLNYPAHPWLGMLAMLSVTTLYGTFLAWATSEPAASGPPRSATPRSTRARGGDRWSPTQRQTLRSDRRPVASLPRSAGSWSLGGSSSSHRCSRTESLRMPTSLLIVTSQ